MNTQHSKELFKKLDDFIGTNNHKPQEERCCQKPVIRKMDFFDTCINCGRMYEPFDDIIKEEFLNPLYQSSTSIGYSNKFKGVYRIHKWINHDYKENMANTNYVIIKSMGKKLGLNEKILNNACMIYKRIYIDNKVSSRNKIKQSLFIYCLYKSCLDYDTSFNIIEALKDNKLSIENYNKSLLKVEDESKLFLNPNMPLQYKKLKDNFTTGITMREIIIEYNRICFISKSKKCKLNNNSILIGSIYNLLNLDDDKPFYNTFNITNTTIKKFSKITN